MNSISTLKSSGRSRRGLLGCLLLGPLLGPQIAIGEPEVPPPLIKLEISADGKYTLDGTPVAQKALTQALIKRQRPGHQLWVHVVPSKETTYKAVEAAMKSVQAAGGKAGMVGNEMFDAAPPPGAENK